MRRLIMRLAIPNIISNITVPLLSIVDVALAGRMGRPEALAAVAVAAGVINFVYWLFAFLRMGTTGFTAQAYGRSDVQRINLNLGRGISFALLAGVLLIASNPLLIQFGSLLSAGRESIGVEAQSYIRVAIWGAPAALLLYVFNGWFVGMQDTRIPMFVAIISNVCNILLSYSFVRFAGYGVEGLAMGTILAQYFSLLLLAFFAYRKYFRVLRLLRWRQFRSTEGIGLYLRSSFDLLLRTALLGTVTLYFTYASASIATITLAANALLMQLFTLFSYFMDGFAYAGEALAGRYIGGRKLPELRSLIRQLFSIALLVSMLVTLLYFLLPKQILGLLSNEQDVLEHAASMAHWAALIPLLSFAAFLWDGILVGATATSIMRSTMIVAFVIFFACYFSLRGLWGESALWMAFLAYLATRGLLQGLLFTKWLKRAEQFQESSAKGY